MENTAGPGVSFALDLPLSGLPSLSTGWTVRIIDGWFVSVGLRCTFRPPDFFTWSYGFGRTVYTPFSFNVTYFNFGPNPVPELNFVRNGTVTVSWSWAF